MQGVKRELSLVFVVFLIMVFENYRSTNPTDLIETPKTSRKLPDTLSEKEINDLIAAIDLSKPLGERNRTILEIVYSCGLRVSEAVTLKISDLFFEGFIRVLGKGNKERFVQFIDKLSNVYNAILRRFVIISLYKSGMKTSCF